MIANNREFQICVRSAEAYKTRHSKGLYCQYQVLGRPEVTKTQTISGTTNPTFDHETLFHYDKVFDHFSSLFVYFCLPCYSCRHKCSSGLKPAA